MPSSVPAASGKPRPQREVVSGEAMVKFSAGVSSGTRKTRLGAGGFEIIKEINPIGWTLVKLPAGASVSYGLGLLKKLKGIEAVEPSNAYRPGRIPNDPELSSQAGLSNIKAFKAWDYETGGSSRVTVALVDTGIDSLHPEISAKLTGVSQFFDPNLGGSQSPDNPPTAACNHATRVAGIAAAESDNDSGIAGISWGGKLLSLKVFADLDCPPGCGWVSCVTDDPAVINAIIYAATLPNTIAYGKIVLNISLGSAGSCAPAIQAAVDVATAAGVMIVSASGNDGMEVISPANCAGVMPVGATDIYDTTTTFTSTGTEMALRGVVAPGVGVYTTDVSSGYVHVEGTSFSTAFTSGLAALIWAATPTISGAQVGDIIRNSADDRGPAGPDSSYGYGRINAYNAMLLALNLSPTIPVSFSGEALSFTSIRWIWADADNETGYRVVSASGTNLSGDLPVDTTYWIETVLTAGVSYSRHVVAFSLMGTSTSTAAEASPFSTPMVAILQPQNNSFVNFMPQISGTATDDVAVSSVVLSIVRLPDNYYWNNASWVASQTWLNADVAGSSWTYVGVPSWVNNSSYTIIVRAVDSSGNWSVAYSTSVFTYLILPPSPAAPVGSVMGVSSIAWSWAALSDVSGYHVYPATAPSSLTGSPSIAAYIHTGLSPNTTYSIVLAGLNASGEGPVSPAATAVATFANIPFGASASAVYATSVTLIWSLNENPSGTTASVLRVGNSTAFTTSGISYTDTGLLGCTTYNFRLWNVNRSIIATQYVEVSSVVTGNPTSLPPGNLSAESLSGNRIFLAWEPAPFEGITGYNLYYDNGTGNIIYGSTLAALAASQTSYTASVPVSSDAYKFALRAVHRCGVEEGNISVLATAASRPNFTGVRASIKIPQSGKRINGNSVTVMAELVTSTPAETLNIRFQYKASASETWQDIIAKDSAIHPNPDATSPYFIHWDVTGLAGSYDLRAVATDLGDTSDPFPAAITIMVNAAEADITENVSGGKVTKEQKVNNLVANTLQAADSASAQVTKVEIPAGALDQSTASVSVTNNPFSIPPAPAGAKAAGVVTEITLSNQQHALAGGQTAAVTLLFQDADNDGIVDGTNLRTRNLVMYSAADSAGPWRADLSSVVNLAGKKVTGNTSHFSFFALFAPLAVNLNSAMAYPVPWRPGSGGRFDSSSGILFVNVPDKTEIRIYTITGQLVRELKVTAADTAGKFWDGKNSSGSKAASGVYLAHIKSGSSVKILKIAVER